MKLLKSKLIVWCIFNTLINHMIQYKTYIDACRLNFNYGIRNSTN